MITKDLQRYVCDNWNDFKVTITEASSSGDGKISLVQSEREVYHFDDICLSIFGEANSPASVDGIWIMHNGNVGLVEFKSGFKKKITRKNFDREKARCTKSGETCEDYWDLFFRHQKSEDRILISSIRDKAIESYVALEKHVFMRCDDLADNRRPVKLNLFVVIDEDPVESMEDILADLADEHLDETNHVSVIRSALKRLVGKVDSEGNTYYYDKIEVMSAREFKCYID